MTLHSGMQAPTIERLGPRDVPDVARLLERDPVMHVYLLALMLRDALGRPRDEWWGARRDGELTALLYMGGLSGAVLPAGDDMDALRVLATTATARRAALPPRFQLIGQRAAVAAVRERFPGPGPALRLEREQLYMTLLPQSLPEFERLPELRTARRDDYAQAFETGAALRAEELLEDPRDIDPVGYGRRVEEDCRDGYTFVWREGGEIIFRASISARTPMAAQISGVYTLPARRNRGVARRALAELCVRQFERSQAVCLFVNTINDPAIALYHRLGFVDHADWASAFYIPPA